MKLRILFIADSRGRYLQAEISRFFDPYYFHHDFIWRGGLRLEEAADFARSTILRFKPHLVYILPGICSITRLTSRDPWTAGLRSPSVNGTVSLFLSGLDNVFQGIYSLSTRVGNPIMIITPTQTGLDFTTYNSYPEDLTSPHQRIIKAAILEINRYVVSLNKSMLIKTPFLGSYIHPRCRHTNRLVYSKLEEGCHPTPELARLWAYKLWKNCQKNSDYYPTYSLINHMY